MFAAAGKQPECPLIDEWMYQMRCVPDTGMLISIKRSDVLTPAAVWRNLDNVMLK